MSNDTLMTIDDALVAREAQDRLVAALRAARFEVQPEDAMVLATAESLAIDGPTAYQQGYELLAELADLGDRVKKHHARFRVPLNTLLNVVRAMEAEAIPSVQPDGTVTGYVDVEAVRKALSGRLGRWKHAQDERDRQDALERQRAADLAAKASQQAKAETLERLADAEPDESMAAMLREQAEEIAAVPVRAAPVAVKPVVPKVDGHVRRTYSAQVEDVRALMQAWLAGTCHLPEIDIVKGLQTFLNGQARSMGHEVAKAYPGVVALEQTSAVSRRRP